MGRAGDHNCVSQEDYVWQQFLANLSHVQDQISLFWLWYESLGLVAESFFRTEGPILASFKSSEIH